MQIVKYPDGTSYAIAKNTELENIDRFTFRLNSYEDLWHLNQMVDSCNSQGLLATVTIPCLIDGQADRRFAPNQSSGLKLVLKFLNSMKANFKIFHPHNAEVVEALLNNVEIIDNSEFIRHVIHRIDAENNYNKRPAIFSCIQTCLTILSPDAGAYKSSVKILDKLGWTGDLKSASKSRALIAETSTLTQQLPTNDFNGKDILIVDDICIYGGTFKGLATMLRERNCGKLYLAVSHITVQNHEKDNVFNYFDRVFTTNSKYDVYYERIDGSSGKEIKNLDIIKLF